MDIYPEHACGQGALLKIPDVIHLKTVKRCLDEAPLPPAHHLMEALWAIRPAAAWSEAEIEDPPAAERWKDVKDELSAPLFADEHAVGPILGEHWSELR